MTHFKIHLDLLIVLVEMMTDSLCRNESEQLYFNSTLDSSAFMNHCSAYQSKSFKRWGRNCEFACHCKNNAQCHPSGLCMNGCEVGWSQATESSPCYEHHDYDHNGTTEATRASTHSKEIGPATTVSSKTPLPVLHERVMHSDRETETNHFDFTHAETESYVDETNFLAPFSFAFDMKCKKVQNSAEISWVLTMSRPLSVYYVYIRIKRFTSFVIAEEHVRAEISLHGYSKSNVFLIIHDTHPQAESGVYFKYLKLPVLLDKLKLSFHAYSLDSSCSEQIGSGIAVLYGMPVCAFRRWGLQCEKHCRCPCRMPECHSLTGSCVDRLVFCPAGKYGINCTKTCSKTCTDDKTEGFDEDLRSIYGSGREPRQSGSHPCHVISGVCRSCSDLNVTGRACEETTDPTELASVLAACQNATLPESLRTGQKSKPGVSTEAPTAGIMELLNLSRGKITLLLVCLCILIFLLGFAAYVTCVKFLARRKFRENMQALERQRMMRSSIKSWSGLKDEFKHFRYGNIGSRTMIDDSVTEGEPSECLRTESSLASSRRGHFGVNLKDLESQLPKGYAKRVSFKH